MSEPALVRACAPTSAAAPSDFLIVSMIQIEYNKNKLKNQIAYHSWLDFVFWQGYLGNAFKVRGNPFSKPSKISAPMLNLMTLGY